MLKKLLLGILFLSILTGGCFLFQKEGKIIVVIPEEYVNLISQIVVNISTDTEVTILQTYDIQEEITFTYRFTGREQVITVYAYDADNNLIFMGKQEYTGDAVLEIELNYAGEGVASHIVVLQDSLPWDTDAMMTMLENEGFTEGTGENQYEIIPSSEFYTLELNPATDLVIIANDQPQSFYDSIYVYDDVINDFVYTGGVLLWEVCDRGWNEGSIDSAGIELPGGITLEYYYDNYNVITMPEHPLFTGLTDTVIYGNYASHEHFLNLPEGTLVLMKDQVNQLPTLVIYPYGAGIVFMTGQPLEHGYAYGYDIGVLLPRLVKLILGREIEETAKGMQVTSEISSHK